MTLNGQPSKPRVLVVDDERVIADTLAIILNQNGFDASAVYTGTAAVDRARETKPDLIISDVIMPDMNGIELLTRLGEVKKVLTPLIVYSAKDFNKKELLHINRNSNRVLTKGINSLEHLLEETVQLAER